MQKNEERKRIIWHREGEDPKGNEEGTREERSTATKTTQNLVSSPADSDHITTYTFLGPFQMNLKSICTH